MKELSRKNADIEDIGKIEIINKKAIKKILDYLKNNFNPLFLDIGSCNYGSGLINELAEKIPKGKAVYFDYSFELVEELNKEKKICADACNMPFPSNTFDLAYAGEIINCGIGLHNYKLVEEAARVIKPQGIFMFTYYTGEYDIQTFGNLKKIGLNNLEHLLRIKETRRTIDTYSARKVNSPRPTL